ncbi:LysR family transcriptional regulator [Lichenicoccus sp.]|uniref:LysR family transcriptional regulator n=1 Tax=Lichenicoccus sp. TaxID=2781899 RepID=UPI003D12F6CA
MNALPSWDLHRTFLAVMWDGSLSAAARQLGLTQPTVARHIEALEQAIGADLFLRSPRGLAPTETAIELLPYAETLAATAAALMRTASGRRDAVRGCVRISASEVVGVEHLPPILARLRERHPGLVLELVLSNALDDLLRRDADIAVRMVAPTQQALLARKLPPVALGLHATSAYLARRGVPASMEALREHDLIGFDRETPALRAFADRFPEVARAEFALRTDSDVAQLAAIRAGFGIGVCQIAVARDLVRVLEEAFAPSLGLWIVMHEDLATSARCRVVFDALADGLAAL